MFHYVTDASKVALWYWVDYLLENNFKLIDVQQDTAHLHSLGARLIPRKDFLKILEENIG
jgi:leucyl/phenylalanyl-tRNA--protein transferase